MASFAFLPSGDDGSNWYRSHTPALALSWLRPKAANPYSRPHSVTASQQLTPDMAKADVIIGSRVAHPNAMPVWKQLKENGHKLVLDLDDDYFHIDRTNPVAWAFWNDSIMDGQKIAEPGQLLENLKTNIELSDVVTVCSQGLSEAIYKETLHPCIRVVENGLNAAIAGVRRFYDPAERCAVCGKGTDECPGDDPPHDFKPSILKVGWAGTQNTAAWLPMIKDVVNKAARDHYGRRVYLEFVGVPGEVAGGMGFRFRKGYGRCIPFIHDMQAYAREVATFDIMVAPYRSTQFTEAKFPTKALEAGMMGIPLIASHIRPYAEWITHGKNGFLVRNHSQHEWGKYLGALINDVKLRRDMGEEARERALDNTMQDYLGVAWEEACLS